MLAVASLSGKVVLVKTEEIGSLEGEGLEEIRAGLESAAVLKLADDASGEMGALNEALGVVVASWVDVRVHRKSWSAMLERGEELSEEEVRAASLVRLLWEEPGSELWGQSWPRPPDVGPVQMESLSRRAQLVVDLGALLLLWLSGSRDPLFWAEALQLREHPLSRELGMSRPKRVRDAVGLLGLELQPRLPLTRAKKHLMPAWTESWLHGGASGTWFPPMDQESETVRDSLAALARLASSFVDASVALQSSFDLLDRLRGLRLLALQICRHSRPPGVISAELGSLIGDLLEEKAQPVPGGLQLTVRIRSLDETLLPSVSASQVVPEEYVDSRVCLEAGQSELLQTALNSWAWRMAFHLRVLEAAPPAPDCFITSPEVLRVAVPGFDHHQREGLPALFQDALAQLPPPHVQLPFKMQAAGALAFPQPDDPTVFDIVNAPLTGPAKTRACELWTAVCRTGNWLQKGGEPRPRVQSAVRLSRGKVIRFQLSEAPFVREPLGWFVQMRSRVMVSEGDGGVADAADSPRTTG